ncbi:hypothetical protein EST38_g10942 [Candolleomyces aberdarensis]|uniref:FAD dependent oxidoreductase domain-containing protein n=1 Tax=Candolleomyces aberdarensis TaxID=2316362 RepID=A0A4Q2D655_9AGAR|nr:hypothetical protein EST38_g10942 [Candolleomyces aberdarensis]
MAREMLLEFARNGGRILRGTVRHIREIVEGGIGAFARPIDGELCKPPAAIVVCAGIGARFIGGIEDTTVFPVRNEVVKLRAPWITMGKAAYDQNLDISVFVVPLGDGDVVIGGHATINDWYPKPRPITVKHLLEKAATLCPELLTPPGDERVPDIQSLVVWEGCDIFGNRRDGPRLDVEWHSAPDFKRKIPVVMNYGYGKAELRAFKGIADAAIRLVDAALAQQMEQIETTS